MTVRDVVRSWLLEYGYAHRMPKVIKALQAPDGGSHTVGTCIVPRMLACTLELILEQEQYASFGVAVHLTNTLYDTAADMLPFKSFVKILTGVKILHLFHLLRSGERLVLPTLNRYFPRSGFKHERGDEKLLRKLTSAQLKFRKFMMSLLSNDALQKRYLKQEFESEYGADFIRKLQQLTRDFVGQIEAVLPATMIDKLLEAGVDSEFAEQIGVAGGLSIDILLDSIQGKRRLSQGEVLDIIDSLSQKSAASRAHYRLDLDILGMDDSQPLSGTKVGQPRRKPGSQEGPRTVLSQKSVEENCKVPASKKPSVKKLDAAPPASKKPRLRSPPGSPKENVISSKTRTPKGKAQTKDSEARLKDDKVRSEDEKARSKDSKPESKQQKSPKSDTKDSQDAKKKDKSSPKQNKTRIIAVKKAKSPAAKKIDHSNRKKCASSSENEVLSPSPSAVSDPKKLTRSQLAAKGKQMATVDSSPERAVNQRRKLTPVTGHSKKTPGKSRHTRSHVDTSQDSQDSQDVDGQNKKTAGGVKSSQGGSASKESAARSPTHSTRQNKQSSGSEVPGSSLQPPGRLLRGSSPRVSSPARSLEPPRSPRRFQASPHPSSPLHLTVLRASPRRHGLDSPIRSKLEEIVDMESKRVGGSRSSHRTTAANSPLITTIHVDDEVSLNVSVDSDDVVLFDEEEDARHQSSSEDDWASCQEETPIRISSTSTVVIGSSDASDGIGETKEADVPGSEEDELIPSSNMDSFLGGYIPSSSFYSKSSQGDTSSFLPPFPPLEQHLRHPAVRPCVVKLYSDQAVNPDGQHGNVDIYH